MFQRSLTLTLSLLLITFAFNISANAQIEKVILHLDAFLCDNLCTKNIESALKLQASETEDTEFDVAIDSKKRQAVLFPNPKKRLDLYDIRKELRNAEHAPWKIEVTVTGEVVDLSKVYSGGHTHPRKALKITETGQQFILKEGEELDKLLAAGHKKVTISGEVPTFLERYQPLLVIKAFNKAKEKKGANPCNPCNPCQGKKAENPCNPCRGKK